MSQSNISPQPTAEQIAEYFERAAATYEEASGEATRAMSRHLLSLCGPSGPFPVPITSTSIIHDNASGPGILASQVIELPEFASGDVPKIHCTDSSPAMIKLVDAKGWKTKYGTESSVMDAQELSFADGTFTHSFTNLAIFMFPDPVTAAREIYRTLQPSGVAFATTLKHTGWLSPYQKAQKRVRPDEEKWQGFTAPEWSQSEHLKKIMLEGGFAAEQLQFETFMVPLKMKVFMEKQKEVLAMATGTITKDWSQEEKSKFDVALQEEITAEIENDNTKIELWIAVAKK